MKKTSDAARCQEKPLCVGNTLMLSPGSLTHGITQYGASDTYGQTIWGSQMSCRALDNSFDSFAATGSSRARGPRGSYGPWKQESGFFKLRGGANQQALPLGEAQPDRGAPSSSTTVQAHQSTAARGTPQVRLASLLMDLMGDDDHTMGNTILSPGQKALYELCKQDLMRSCSEYEQDWTTIFSRSQEA